VRKVYPCPFCGSKKIETFETWKRGFTVECDNCFAAGPRALTQNKAIEAWNVVQPGDREQQKIISRGVPP